jgi:hypothetical protein
VATIVPTRQSYGLAQSVQGVAIPTPSSVELQNAVRSRISWRSECIECGYRHGDRSSGIRTFQVGNRSQVQHIVQVFANIIQGRVKGLEYLNKT